MEGLEDWGTARQNRPTILFQLHELVPVIPACIPTPFMFGGCRVLDRKKQWMTYWSDVPVTCSSMIEGDRLEALMRRNPALQYWDILARMPDQFLFKNRMRSPFLPSTLTNRTKRFRLHSFNVPCKSIASTPDLTTVPSQHQLQRQIALIFLPIMLGAD